MQRATLVLRTNPILPSRQLRWQDPIWSCKSPHLYSTMVVYSFTPRWRPSPSFTELNGGDISTVGKNDPHLSLAPSSVSGLRSGVGVTRFPFLVRAVSVGFHESRETSPPFAGWIRAAWAPIARCRGLRRLRRTIRPWLPRSSFGPLGSCGLRMLPPVMGSCPCLSASAGLLF